jgi:uncharacterized protein YkwD
MKLVILLLSIILLSQPMMASSMEKEVFRLINQYRNKKKLPNLAYDGRIASAAAKHSRDMASHRVGFGHSGFDNRMDKLLKNIKGANAAAENVAYGAKTAERVVDMWINSSGHRKNIVGKYTLTGVGIARGKNGTLYFTQIFINVR